MPKKKAASKRTAKKKPRPTPRDDIADPVLGTLRFTYHINPKLAEFEGQTAFGDQPVNLLLYTDDNLDLQPTTKRTKELKRRSKSITKRAEKYLVQNVLPHYNEIWREKNEAAIKEQQLLDAVTLTDISVHADGKATFDYSVGDLFAGHGLWLRLNADDQFYDHDTPG